MIALFKEVRKNFGSYLETTEPQSNDEFYLFIYDMEFSLLTYQNLKLSF